MEVDVKKVMLRLEELYQCGARDDGTFTRMAYSNEDIKGRKLFTGYLEELGLSVRMDEAGNLTARLEGSDPALPAIMVGSHLDTVPDGGKYDGALGCISAVGVCEALVQSGHRLRHPLEVIVFTDEEGFRFGSGLLGSSALCGERLDIKEDDLDMHGLTRREVFQNYKITAADVAKAKKDPKSIHCFLELHIEQGGTLDKNKIPIGIVSSIAGVSRYEVRITGQANHAGSTVMGDRRDALVAAARFIAEVPRIVERCGSQFTVATVGTIKVTPNSVNVIPGTCDFLLEIRDQDEKIMEMVELELKAYAEKICGEMGETLSFEHLSYHEPAPMSNAVRHAVENAAMKLKIEHTVIPSGAFHDSLLMTRFVPTGMIFVPSEKGISHSRDEYTKEEDIRLGCNVLLETVLEVDNMNTKTGIALAKEAGYTGDTAYRGD